LATPSYLDQSRPNLKVWTPTWLNLMALPVHGGVSDYPRVRVTPHRVRSMPLS